MNQKTDARIITIDINKMLPKQEPNPIRDILLRITKNKEWCNEAKKLSKQSSFDEEFISEFHTYWTEAGHHIRSQIGDDKKLVGLLRLILPKYSGQNIQLYRGENLDRWQIKQVGLCWTSCIKTARMFGGGLNAIESGGVLLEANCPLEAIISGPSRHSLYLGESEYTIDPYKLSAISVVEQFPATHITQ